MRRVGILLGIALVQSLAAAPEDVVSGRVRSHLVIGDPNSALEEVQSALERYPYSQTLAAARIEVLAALGLERQMLEAWREYATCNKNAFDERPLIENMAWGVLNHGAQAASHTTQLASMLVAHSQDDARAVRILVRGLRCPSTMLRGIAVELAQKRRDPILLEEMRRLYHQEHDFEVRLSVLRALGRMKIIEARRELEGIIGNTNYMAEEQVMAIESLVNLLEDISVGELQTLVNSSRAGMRRLATQAVALFGRAEHVPYIMFLTQDLNASVRTESLQVLGLLYRLGIVEDSAQLTSIARRRLGDTDAAVGISAAWLMLMLEPAEARAALEPKLRHPISDVRLQAVAALSHSGAAGLSLLRKTFHESQDSYVRLNAALGLISQRADVEPACAVLAQAVGESEQKWMWRQGGMWRYVAPSTEVHRPGVPNYPEAINQMVRLELLSVLAMMDHPDALPAIREFLTRNRWGLSGVAAALLLVEGSEDAFDLVAKLLDDGDKKVRLQAALVLGLLAGDSRAVSVLEDGYVDGDRVQKEQILEALGKIGKPQSLPFLVERLGEPQQNLRVLAAGALLQCLNH